MVCFQYKFSLFPRLSYDNVPLQIILTKCHYEERGELSYVTKKIE